MNPLIEQLLQRHLAAQPPQAASVPPSPTAKVPTETKRWENAQQIQNAYRGNWSPNPVLLQASLKG